MTDGQYSIEFYEDEHGDDPVRRWLTRELSVRKRRVLGIAMFHFLQRYGAGVCDSEFGKPLGQGLYEFRVRHDLPEMLRKAGIEHRMKRQQSEIAIARARLAEWKRRAGTSGPT